MKSYCECPKQDYVPRITDKTDTYTTGYLELRCCGSQTPTKTFPIEKSKKVARTVCDLGFDACVHGGASGFHETANMSMCTDCKHFWFVDEAYTHKLPNHICNCNLGCKCEVQDELS